MTNTSSSLLSKGGKGNKRKYTRKFANGPKRPLSAYNLFFRAERERILAQCVDITITTHTTKKGKRAHRKSHGAVNFSEMGKQIAVAWKALDEEARAPFVADAAQDMKRYQEAKEEAKAKEVEANKQQATVPDPPCKTQTPTSKTPLQTNIGQETTKKPHQGITNQTAQAFSPPSPANKDGPLPPSSTTITQDYAFQCEVCLTAIFPTYDECLQHEQKCQKPAKNEAETIV